MTELGIAEAAAAVIAADILIEGSGAPVEGSPTPPGGSDPTGDQNGPSTPPKWSLVPDLRWSYDLDDGQTVTLGIYAERIDGTDTGNYEVRAWGPWAAPRYPHLDNTPNLWKS